jgi:hypothetical protein
VAVLWPPVRHFIWRRGFCRRSAFAGDVKTAKTEADCKAAGGMWDAATNTCAEKKM